MCPKNLKNNWSLESCESSLVRSLDIKSQKKSTGDKKNSWLPVRMKKILEQANLKKVDHHQFVIKVSTSLFMNYSFELGVLKQGNI